ncbi:hypothetical protein NQ318_006746 [Aromia moschata]|uniref:Uncharacterized protein n=1 Tax=Aromia moschata TaxID=1265417 RepID=A0AAV8YEX2_9CUCU|nr:hypothetical protein NQ318_006746 [Aromia moschata]
MYIITIGEGYHELIKKRLGESEGSYCTLATFPSDSSSESSSSTPTNTPPSTPLQEKPKKVQRPTHQRYNALDHPNKYRNHANMAVSSLRVKPSPRELSISEAKYLKQVLSSILTELGYYSPACVTRGTMNFNFNPNRPMYRCDGPPFPLTPAFYRNMNYNRPHYKNVLRV